MSTRLLPSKLLVVFASACLMWIALLSLAVISFMGTGIGVGWIVAGALGASLLVWIVVMAGEFGNAIEMPEEDEAMDFATCDVQPFDHPCPGLFSSSAAGLLELEAAALKGRKEFGIAVRAQTTG